MKTLEIILLVIQLGVFGFLLFYALPRMIKSRRQFKKEMAEIQTEMEESKKIFNLCMPIFKGTATDTDIAAFEAYVFKREERNRAVERTYKS